MAKAWYNFFLVTDDQHGGAVPPAGTVSDAATVPTADPTIDAARRAAVVGGPDPSFTAPVTNLTPLADIYNSAQIAAPSHGYTVLKVADMLQSEHIRALPADVKRKSILVALEAAGVTVDEIVADAVHRDRALDTYERVLEQNLDALRAEKQAENARLEQEISERLAELRARIDANNRDLSSELDHLRAWQARKQDEERRISEAVGYFVSENPITTTTPSAPPADKGDANARQT